MDSQFNRIMPNSVTNNRPPSFPQAHAHHHVARDARGARRASTPEDAGAQIDSLAAGARNEADILDLLNSLSNGDLNHRLNDGQTLLYKAVHSGSEQIVTELLLRGADPRGRNRLTLNTPLHAAVENADIKLVTLIMEDSIERGKHLGNELNERGETPLYAAARAGHTDIVTAILRGKGINPDQECSADRHDDQVDRKPITTALGIAISKGHKECVIALSRHGATDKRGRTLLHFAVLYRMDKTFNSVLQNTKSRRQFHRLLNGWDRTGSTPLIYAVTDGVKPYTDALLKEGAKLEKKDKSGRNALYTAVARAKKGGDTALQIVRDLLKAADDRSVLAQVVDARENKGKTPLMKAVENKNLACIDALLEAGADVSLRTKEGKNVFHFAVEKGNTEILGRLLKAASKQICLSDALGASAPPSLSTPLIHAMTRGHMTCAEMLLKVKTAVEFPDAMGNNVLHAALDQPDSIGHLRFCMAAVKNHGLFDEFLDGQTIAGKTPLLKAIQLGQGSCVQLLLEEGANPTVADQKRLTALDHALEDTAPEVIADQGSEDWPPEAITDRGFEDKPPEAATDRNGLTALGYAVKNKEPEVLLKLLAWLKKDNDFKRILHLVCEGDDGYAPLAFAAKLGHAEHIAALAEAGASIVFASESGQNALQAALRHGHLDLVLQLLAISKEKNNLEKLLNSRDAYGRTALLFMLQADHTARINILVDEGKDIGEAKAQVKKEVDACVDALLAAGADPSVCDAPGRNALHMAIALDRPDLALKFVSSSKEHGTLPALLEGDGEPALLYLAKIDLAPRVIALERKGKDFSDAAVEVDEAFAKWANTLLDEGARLAGTDGNGRNLLHIGAQYGNFDLLLEVGRKADKAILREMIAATDEDGVQPVVYAAAYRPDKSVPDAEKDFREAQKMSRKRFMGASFALGASILAKDKEGKNALHHVIELGQFELIPLLLKEASDQDAVSELVNAKDNKGVSPLLYLARHKLDDRIATLKDAGRSADDALKQANADRERGMLALLKSGADLTGIDESGRSVLHWALEFGNLELAMNLLNAAETRFPDNLRDFVNTKDSQEMTPLLMAMRHRFSSLTKKPGDDEEGKSKALSPAARKLFEDFIEGLVDAGTDFSYAMTDGTTALHLAAAHEQKEVLEIALEAFKAEIDYAPESNPTIEHLVNCADQRKRTPLYYSIQHNLAEQVRLLIQAGADPKTVNGPSSEGGSALHQTVKNGHDEVAHVLLQMLQDDEFDADTARSLKDELSADTNSENSLLVLAVKQCDRRTLELMIEQGADFEYDESRNTLMHYAADLGASKDTLAFLLEQPLPAAVRQTGASSWLEVRNIHEYTPLHSAARTCKIELIELLIEKGAKLDAQDHLGRNLFHIAVDKGFEDIIHVAMKAAGLHSSQKRENVFRLILNDEDNYGNTPLNAALNIRSDTIVMQIIENVGLEDIPLPTHQENKIFLIETIAKSDKGAEKLNKLFHNRFNKKSEWGRSTIPALFQMKIQARDYDAAVALLPAMDDEVVFRHRKVLLEAAFSSRSNLSHARKHRLATQLGTIYIDQLSGVTSFADIDVDQLEEELSVKQTQAARRFAAILFGSRAEVISDEHDGLFEKFKEAGKSEKLLQEIFDLVRRTDSRRSETERGSGVFTEGTPLLPREGDQKLFLYDLGRLQAMEMTAHLLRLLDSEKYAL